MSSGGGVEEALHHPSGQPDLLDCGTRSIRQESSRFRMGGIPLGDHGIACCDRRGEITTRNRVECQWEVVRADHQNCTTQWFEPGTDV